MWYNALQVLLWEKSRFFNRFQWMIWPIYIMEMIMRFQKSTTAHLLHYNNINLFLSNTNNPSSRILHNSLDMALLSTDRKSANCWRLKGISNVLQFCLLASSERQDISLWRVVLFDICPSFCTRLRFFSDMAKNRFCATNE